MDIQAQHRNARMSPRKIRLMRGVVRGLSVAEAQAQLKYLPGKASEIVGKVLQSAVANAKHNYGMEADKLQVKDVVVDGSFTLKRFMPVSKGMAHEIRKHNAHVTVVVTDGQAGTVAARKSDADIETVPADEVPATEQEPETVAGEEKAPADKGLVKPPANQAEQAFQKKKMQQMGGNRRKTGRRKSPSSK